MQWGFSGSKDEEGKIPSEQTVNGGLTNW